MRKLIAVIVVAALVWSGWWVVGSTAVARGVAAWFEAQRANGVVAEYDDLAVRGFPNRFDTTLTDVALADPESGLAWEAPFFQIFALSYRPNHIIAIFPDTQTVTGPLGTARITSGKMRGSVVFTDGTDLALDHGNLVAEDVAIDSGVTMRLETLRLASRRPVGQAQAHEVALEILGLAPDPRLIAAIAPNGDLPETVQTLRLDAVLHLDAPLDRFAAEVQPRLERLDMTGAEIAWGPIGLSAEGSVTVDGAGRMDGRVDLTVTDWRALLGFGEAAGLIAAGPAANLDRALSLFSGISGSGAALEFPLILNEGQMFLGPVPLGAAPLLR